MMIDTKTVSELGKKAELFDKEKEKTHRRIHSYIDEAIKKLEITRSNLLGEMEVEFTVNPFSEFLSKFNSNENTTDDEIQFIKSVEIPTDFGPTKESFLTLCDEIETFESWRDKSKKKKKKGEGEQTWSDLIPKNIKCTKISCGSVSISWDAIDEDFSYEVKVEPSPPVRNRYCSDKAELTLHELEQNTKYTICVRSMDFLSNRKSMWSNPITVQTRKRKFSQSEWKRIPNIIGSDNNYSVDGENPRIASNIGNGCCSVIGNTLIPPNQATSWKIKVLKSWRNNGGGIYIGVAPSDINQWKDDNNDKCGWYFYCWGSTLFSGPPHNYKGKEYGPRKEDGGQYVHTGDSVGVVMDTTKGELSFVLNGVNLGVAYEGIPLDKPLVPCVLLGKHNDSVELDPSGVKETMDRSILVPSNITSKSTTWDSITLTWDAVEGASFYQIEEDGNKSCLVLSTNTFTKRGLLPETKHTFRVRAVRGNSVSEWSNAVRGRTQKESFEGSWWKECPDDVDEDLKYSVDEENLRIATKFYFSIGLGDYYCTIIGNIALPLNKVTSWSIKILKSKYDGSGIYVGVAPPDINQNEDNYNKCGWYFNCYGSGLWSGPPHNYGDEEYGPRKGDGKYVHTRDIVGVVMDTKKGELSFVVNGVNLGVAFEGIPLDKPLVPCVLLYHKGDSVELDTSEVKENVDRSILVPSNITVKSITWDSITLTWDAVEEASFYQIEVYGSKFWGASTANTFTKRGLLPETEHTFKVRAVRGNSVGEWSDVVRGRTQKESFEGSWWKECPDDVDEKRKYSVDEENLRIATKNEDAICVDDKWINTCAIIGNTPLPPNQVISWSIKVLKSRGNDGSGISIGVAPSDINQNEDNSRKCGWYFNCYSSSLWSGPSHDYSGKQYGPRKENAGEYVHTGDSVGVVMDTAKGELSFVVNGVNLGVAFEGIPLDKPLVSCVILYNKGDSIELVI